MKIYTLERETILPVSPDKAWSFFSDPRNLVRITPPGMAFRIISNDLPEKVYTGQKIQYSVAPLWRIKMTWISEIKEVNEPFFFVDEQAKGPYAYWRHEHRFEEWGSTTIMHDKVLYGLPLGIMGILAHRLAVHKKLKAIFDYREKMIMQLFRQ